MKLSAPAETGHVKAGVLIATSPSALSSFDTRTTWGCKRKWWLEQVAGQKPPADASQAKGEAIHKQIEHYLFTGENKLGPEALAAKHLIDSVRKVGSSFQLEQWIPEDFAIAGVRVRGRLDFIARTFDGLVAGVYDWKTTSDIQKYAKLPHQLPKDHQMVVYRAAAAHMGCIDPLPMGLVYMGTKRREAEIVEVRFSEAQLSAGIHDIQGVLAGMKEVAKATDSDDVEPDRTKCDVGRGCPHRMHCTKGTMMASLLERMAAMKAAPSPVETKAAPAPAPAPVVAPVLPPDAPASKPELASARPAPVPTTPEQAEAIIAGVPVAQVFQEATTAVNAGTISKQEYLDAMAAPAAPKRGPGRPPGSGNKPKTAEVTDAPKAPSMAVVEVTLSHGMTINLGDYNSARVDVTMRATLSGGMDEKAAREQLHAKVIEALDAEASEYLKHAKVK